MTGRRDTFTSEVIPSLKTDGTSTKIGSVDDMVDRVSSISRLKITL